MTDVEPKRPRIKAETAEGRAAREARLAGAMRANLRKRKERQRALERQAEPPKGRQQDQQP